jgi:hypothetical protein
MNDHVIVTKQPVGGNNFCGNGCHRCFLGLDTEARPFESGQQIFARLKQQPPYFFRRGEIAFRYDEKLTFGFRLSWNVDSKGKPFHDSLHASDDRFLLPDYGGMRQRNPEHSRQRIGRFFGCDPPTARGGSKRSDADRIRAKDRCLCDGANLSSIDMQMAGASCEFYDVALLRCVVVIMCLSISL